MKQRQVREANQHVHIGAINSHIFAMAVVLGIVVCAQRLSGAEGGNLWLPPVEVPNSSDRFHHISDGAGGAMVACLDGGSPGPVYVSRISNAGATLWGPVLLSSTGVSGRLPRLCSDGAGGAMVAWAQDVSGGQSIYVQRINSSGTPQWANPVGASTNASGFNSLEVAAGSGGMFLLYHVSAGYSVCAAHISAAGVVASPGLGGLWLGTSSVDRGKARLVPDGSAGTGVIVAWQDNTDYSLKAQRVVLSGGTLNQAWGGGSAITICSTTGGDAHNPAVAQDGSGGALISWNELYLLDGKAEIRIQKVNSSGVAQWTPNGVVLVDSTVVGGNYGWWVGGSSSAIVGDGSGGAYVAWDDWRNANATNSMDVYAQRVNASAVPQWASWGIRLGDYMFGSQCFPAMVTDLQGGALVTFQDAAAGSVDISLVKLNSAGKEWFRFVFSDSADPGGGYDQHNPAVIYDASGAAPKGCIVAWAEKTWATYMQKVQVGQSTGAVTLLSCSGEPAGDGYDRGFYVPQYPGVSLNSARLELSAAVAGTYGMSLTVRSNTYDGPILGVSSSTVTLSSDVYDNQPIIFTFPSTPIAKYSRVCFILSWLSGPGTQVYYSVAGLTGGCTEVVETEGTTPPLDTFRRYGVNLVLTGASIPPETLLSCSGLPGGDDYYYGFYVRQYPGVSLNSARLKLSATIAGTYGLTLTVRSNTYDGPVLGVSSSTVTLSSDVYDNQPITFTFTSTPIAKYSRVCFILSLTSGPPFAQVFYSVAGLTGGCTEVVETEDTTPPLSTFRRYGVDLVLTGVNDPSSDLSSAIAQQPAGLYLYWKSIAGRTYTVQTNDNLQLFNALQTGITATPPTNTFGPIVPAPTGRQFYRVMLEPIPVP